MTRLRLRLLYWLESLIFTEEERRLRMLMRSERTRQRLVEAFQRATLSAAEFRDALLRLS